MLKPVKRLIKKAAHKAGYGLVRLDADPSRRRIKIMRHHDIQTVVDVGANIGGYGAELRETGFSGKIISFEPTSLAYEQLAVRAQADGYWRTFNAALGERDGEVTINVAANRAESSSLLPMLKLHDECAPYARYVSTEKVHITTLDNALFEEIDTIGRIMLKIDAQGYEHMILRGSARLLRKVELIECELSLVPLYEGQLIFPEMTGLLKSVGFEPIQFMPGFTDPLSGHNLQVDGIFARLSKRN